MSPSTHYDLAVVGAGFGGCLAALVARRLGRSVVLLERSRHPRFAIGESSTPQANLLLEELATRFDLPALTPFSKWGTWQRAHPQVACGLKRGFSFFHHTWNRTHDPDHQLLVAASPNDHVADTHWYRADFDAFLAQYAHHLGADLLEGCALESVLPSQSGFRLRYRNGRDTSEISAARVLDASGCAATESLAGPRSSPEGSDASETLYCHFAGVQPFTEANPAAAPPPYPPDDAAVHHLFPGGWIWVLRFNNGITSAGVVARGRTASELRLADGEPAWHRLLQRLPSLARSFRDARPIRRFQHAAHLDFERPAASGYGWAALPSATGFVDPLLSSGFALNLLGILELADWIETGDPTPPTTYPEGVHRNLASVRLLVRSLYATFNSPDAFRQLALLYFTAVSFSETARRIGHPERAPGFLLNGNPTFQAGFEAACHLARSASGNDTGALHRDDVERLTRIVRETIHPFDLGGFSRPASPPWYPVNFPDLERAADRIQATPEDLQLLRAAFNAV